MSEPIRGLGSHLVFPIDPKNKNLVGDVMILLLVKFRWILFSCFREVEKVSVNKRQGRPEKHKLGREPWDLAYCQVSLNSVQRFQRIRKCLSNQRQGRPLCFSDWPEKHKLGRGRWDLASCQVSLNSVQRIQRRSRKCLSQSEARAAIFFFPIGPKNTNLVEFVEFFLPVKFRLILFSGVIGEVENVKS